MSAARYAQAAAMIAVVARLSVWIRISQASHAKNAHCIGSMAIMQIFENLKPAGRLAISFTYASSYSVHR